MIEVISDAVDFFAGQPIDFNPDYGFRQLTEIALKAFSLGINDPGTAVISLNSLSNLFQMMLYHKMPSLICDLNQECRIFLPTTNLLNFLISVFRQFGTTEKKTNIFKMDF